MSEQHDPVDELARFGAELGNTPGGAMPLSPAAVRRRGDQIRRRRTALVATASALAVAAVTVPVFAVIGGGNDDSDLPATDPTNSRSLGVHDLLTDDETVYNEGSDWFTTETFEGDGQAAFQRCARQSLGDLGATSIFQRDFEMRPVDPAPGDVPDTQRAKYDRFREAVAEFPDAAQATAAYDTIAGWITDCAERRSSFGATEYRALQTRPADTGLGRDTSAQIIDAQFGPAPAEIDPTGDAGFIAETGLVRVGNRIAVLDSVIVGFDYNFTDEEGGTPVNQMIPSAAELLQPGGSTPPTVTAGPTDGSTAASGSGDDADPGDTASPDGAIPDDFPLTDGWPEVDGDGDVSGPARDLDPTSFEACGAGFPDADYADRLRATWSQPEDFRSRQLTTYDTADDAVAAVAAIREIYAECPEGPKRADGFTPHYEVRDTTLGGESFVVLGWDELDGAPTTFGDVLLVVRLGSAVLVVAHGGHSGNPQGQEQRKIDQITQESATVVAQMCPWTEAGC